MATSDTASTRLPAEVRLGATVFGLGAFAALGSTLVALGLTDVLAYAEGPGRSAAVSYLTAFGVATAGWSLLVAVVFATVRTALGPR